MKTVLGIFLVLIITRCVLTQGLHDVCSPELAIVYAVGDNGTILKSNNGGNTYSSVVSGTSTLRSVCGVSFSAWSVGDDGSFSRSTDKGVTWTNQSIAGGVDLTSVFFVDTLTGYIAGANGLVLKCNDGGNSWTSLSSGTGSNLTDIRFINSTTGYLSGENGFFAKTTNAGAMWNAFSLPAQGKVCSFGISGNTIILGLDASRLVISTNAGATWQLKSLDIISMPAIVGIKMASDSSFGLALESGTVWNSTNFGASFTYAKSPMYSRVSSMDGFSLRVYCVSPDHKAVLKSDNLTLWSFPTSVTSTMNFELLLNGSSSPVSYNKTFDMNYQKRGTFYVMQAGFLKRTRDFGETWTQMTVLPVNNICQQFMVNMKDSAKMIAVMNTNLFPNDSIKVLRSTNYGVSWQVTYRAPGVDYIGNMMVQDPSHPDTIYMGVKDSVMRSTNWGATWQNIATYPFEDWCDLAVNSLDPKIIYAATNHRPAKIHKSTDGGFNWSMIDFVADTGFSEMPAIALTNLNPNIVLHVQFGGGISGTQTGLKRSYTGGNSWLYNPYSTTTSWAVDIAKDNPELYSHGAVSYTPVYLSSNAGGTFTASPNHYAEQILYYDRANLFVNSHGEISKLVVSYIMPVIGIEQISSTVPEKFMLEQNYPNPFNPETNINFSVPEKSDVKLAVYDVTGREIAVLVNSSLTAGTYKTEWDAASYSSGIYFYRITGSNFTDTKKMILVK